jgi:hypothetical protein
MQAYNCAIAPVIFGDHLLTWKDVLAHRYGIRSYQKRVAIQCPRRFGKSLWTCIFLICLCVAYLKCGLGAQSIMVCASNDQSEENYKYDCMALEALRGHWSGEYTSLDWCKPKTGHRLFVKLLPDKDAVKSEVFMTPNINMSGGKVRFQILFAMCGCRGVAESCRDGEGRQQRQHNTGYTFTRPLDGAGSA